MGYKAYHHARVMWSGGVISDRARFCHEFGVNPDVEELERYNREGKARECDHSRLRFHDGDDDGRCFYTCGDCDLGDPNWRDKFVACPKCKWRLRGERCGNCNGTHLVRATPPPT